MGVQQAVDPSETPLIEETVVTRVWPWLIVAVGILAGWWTWKTKGDWQGGIAVTLLAFPMVSLDGKTPLMRRVGLHKVSASLQRHPGRRDWLGAISLLTVGLASGFYIGSWLLTDATNHHRAAVVFTVGVILSYAILLLASFVVASVRVATDKPVSTSWKNAGFVFGAIGFLWGLFLLFG